MPRNSTHENCVYRSVFDLAAIGMALIDLNGIFLDANTIFCERTGFNETGLSGKSYMELVLPDDIPAFRDACDGLLRGDVLQQKIDQRYFRKNGCLIWGQINLSLVRDAQGAPTCFSCQIVDFQECGKPFLDDLRWHDVFMFADMGVVVGNTDGQSLDLMNPAFARMHGYTVEELVGQSIAKVIVPCIAQTLPEQVALANRQGHRVFESWHQRKDGSIFPVSVDITIVRDGDGKTRYAILYIQDITKRKKIDESLALKSLAIDHVREAAYLIGEQARFVYVNDEACRMLGYTREELLTMSVPDIDPDYVKNSGQEIMSHLARERALTFETRHRTRDGQILAVEIYATLFEYGERTYALTLVRNITESKKTNERLALKNFALDHVHEAAYLIDKSVHFIYVNDEACRMLGYSREELLAMSVPDIDPDYTADHCRELKGRILKGDPSVIETRHLTRDGQILAVEVCLTHFEYEAVSYTLALVRDISGRKRAETALRESEQRYREVFDNVSDILFLLEVTPEGRCRYLEVNRAFERASGMARAELIGHFSGFHPSPQVAQGFVARNQRCLDAGTVIDEVHTHDLPSGQRIYHTTRIPLRAESGRIHRIVGLSRDLTNIKKAEQDLQQSNRALRLLSACNRVLIHAVNEEQMLGEICQQIVEVGGFRMSWVGYARHDEDKTVQPVAYGGGAESYLAHARISWADSGQAWGVTGQAIRTGRTQVNLDFQNNPAMAPWHAAARKYGFQSRIALPLGRWPDALGAINIYSDNPQAFKEEEIALLEELAGNLTFGIASLRERAERQRAEMELRSSEQKYRTLAENSPSIVLRYDRECRRTFVNRAYVRETQALMDDALLAIPGIDWRANIPVEEYLAVLQQVMASEIPAEIQLEWKRLNEGLVTSLALQVVPEYGLDGKVEGALAIGHNITALKLTERHLQESLALSHELMSQREIAIEAERKHIAREIHDELGQQLTTLHMGVSSLRLQFGHNNPALLERVQGLIALADNTIQVMRNVASALRPSVVDAGIVSALEWLLTDFSRHSGITTRLSEPEGEIHLDDMRATALFRIVQESLTNVARYAAASQVNVTMQLHGDDFLLEVRDNGCGFDPATPARKTLGLVGMRERALMLGGELTINSAPGQGTVIRVRIPVQENGAIS